MSNRIQQVELEPGQELEVHVTGLGSIYTIYTEIDADGSLYVELVDDRNGRVLDQDNLEVDYELG